MARKVVTEGKDVAVEVTPANLNDYLGIMKYRDFFAEKKNEIGLTTGLAWTEVGGEVLSTEATLMEGKGRLTLTGKLGDVMQESAQAAMSYIRSRSQCFGLPKDFYRHLDIHMHVPEGAIPKDGPSAGITICTSIVSALTLIPVRCDIAMTGEITLRGKVLPIGGVKEKLLAAHRLGLRTHHFPERQRKRSGGYSAGNSGADVHSLRRIHGRGLADCAGASFADSRRSSGTGSRTRSSARTSRRTMN